jgi:hypothetical protein
MTGPGNRDGGGNYATFDVGREEEVLDTSPRRPDRRNGLVAPGVALLVAAVVAVLVAQHLAAGKPRAVATTQAPTLAVAPPAPFPVADSGPPPALMIGSTLYMVRDGSLIAHRTDSIAETSVTVGDAADTGGSYLLAADPKRSRIWVVKSLPARILVYGYDLPGLRESRRLHIEGQVAGIDELNGELYISASSGVVGIAGPRASGLLDWTPLRGGRAIAADGTRNRLLLLDEDGTAVRVRAESPDLTRSGISADLPFLTGSFAVVNGRIWAGGSDARGAVLVRLDPRTLRPIRHSDIVGRLGSGVAFAAAGTRSFLIRDVSGGAGLWCIDADSGKILHSWAAVAGPVVINVRPGAARNAIYAVPTGSTPVQLEAGNCPG